MLRERWMRFWFEPVGPQNLGLCRILFFGAFFLFYLRSDFSAWGEVSESFWMPVGIFKVLHLSALSGSLLAAIQIIWKISLALSCIGIFTRPATICSFIFGAYLLGLPHNFGKIHHFDALVVIVLGIMAVSRCGDAYSIDQLMRRGRRRGASSSERLRASGEYTWPVRAVWVTFALIFFAAGVSKLRHSGLEWIFSDNMAILLTRSVEDDHPLLPWGVYLVEYSWLPQLLAAGTIALEISYPLALFSRKARWVIVPSVFFMQIGIWVFMGPTFLQFLICNLFWVPWDRISHKLTRRFHKLLPLDERLVPFRGKRPRQDSMQR
jgi:hypothetical protein